jgi:hypothetical protein
MRFTELATPRPINTAPEQDEEAVVLLYWPEQGGWHTGVYFDGSWRLHFELNVVLEPTHWAPAPRDVDCFADS